MKLLPFLLLLSLSVGAGGPPPMGPPMGPPVFCGWPPRPCTIPLNDNIIFLMVAGALLGVWGIRKTNINQRSVKL